MSHRDVSRASRVIVPRPGSMPQYTLSRRHVAATARPVAAVAVKAGSASGLLPASWLSLDAE
eukprot:352965-Chlamydomonas_euryale.AAC.7